MNTFLEILGSRIITVVLVITLVSIWASIGWRYHKLPKEDVS